VFSTRCVLQLRDVTIEERLEAVLSMRSVPRCKQNKSRVYVVIPCWSGVKYLHRSPACRGDEKGSLKSERVNYDMVASSKGLGPENDCAGEAQQQL
jgi:hypothetical protein